MHSVVSTVLKVFEVVNWVFYPPFVQEALSQFMVLSQHNEYLLGWINSVFFLELLDGVSCSFVYFLLTQVFNILFCFVYQLEYFLSLVFILRYLVCLGWWED